MQDHDHDQDAGHGGGMFDSFWDALSDTHGVAFALVVVIAGAVVIGVGLAILGALRRRTAMSVIGVVLTWTAPCIAYVALAKLGNHVFYTIVRGTQPIAALGMGFTGLLLTIHLAPARLERKHLIAGATGAIMAIIAAFLILTGWGDIRSIPGVTSSMLWGSAALALALSICMLYHLLQGDYALDLGVRRFMKIAFPILGIYALGGGYVIYDQLANDAHLRIHVQLLRIDEAINQRAMLLNACKQSIDKDTTELRRLRSAGTPESDERIQTLLGAIKKAGERKLWVESLTPKLESAKWFAQRLEHDFHSLNYDDALLSLQTITAMADAATGSSDRDIDAILDKGLNDLGQLARKSDEH